MTILESLDSLPLSQLQIIQSFGQRIFCGSCLSLATPWSNHVRLIRIVRELGGQIECLTERVNKLEELLMSEPTSDTKAITS